VLLRRRHDEGDARRRFFQRLEQGVKGRARQHVNFVYDENFVAVARRRDSDVADDRVAHVVNAGV
jgi:hypothetical protein